MYAQVRFIQKNGLSNTYDYSIPDALVNKVSAGDYVVIESSRTDYSVGVLHKVVAEVADPKIVTKGVVQLVNRPKCPEYTLDKINVGGMANG